MSIMLSVSFLSDYPALEAHLLIHLLYILRTRYDGEFLILLLIVDMDNVVL